MTTYKIAKDCPDVIVLEVVSSQNSDFSYLRTLDASWDEEKDKEWVQDAIAHGKTLEECKEDFFGSLELIEYEQSELIDILETEDTWPLELGFIEKA